MPNDRRAFVPGGCFFFTVNPLERKQTLLVDHIARLREAVATTWAEIIPSLRRIRRVARSPACGLDPATGGLRCLDALAADQKPFCQSAAKTGSTECRSQSARGPSPASGNGGFRSISSAMTPMTHAMSNIVTSIRSSTAWSSACATGRIHRFTATWARGCFRSIGAAISKRSVSGGTGEANFTRGIAAWNGGLRLRLQSALRTSLARKDEGIANCPAVGFQ